VWTVKLSAVRTNDGKLPHGVGMKNNAATSSNVCMQTWQCVRCRGGTAAAAPPPSGLATLPSVEAVP